jgi:hypothetical protein
MSSLRERQVGLEVPLSTSFWVGEKAFRGYTRVHCSQELLTVA